MMMIVFPTGCLSIVSPTGGLLFVLTTSTAGE